MIAAAVIAGIVALVGAFIGGYYLGRKNASGDAAAAAVKDEQAENSAALAAREKIEAAEKAQLEKVPGAPTGDLAQDIWGANADGGILTVEKKK